MRNIYRCVICGAYTEEPYHCGREASLILKGRDRVRLSKLMSYLLRHNPGAVGLRMNSEGWVSISELVRGIRERWVRKDLYQWVSEEHVIAIAMLDPKGRFEVKEGLIRARYGHERALDVSIDYEVDNKSKVLYHGTNYSNVTSIMKYGIVPMRRKYVHLSVDVKTACETGRRHGGNPVYLVVNAECLRSHGINVLVGSKLVRLVSEVPPDCIIEVRKCR